MKNTYHRFITVIAFLLGLSTAYFINDNRTAIKKFIQRTLNHIQPKNNDLGLWSIGIYEGRSPFHLIPSNDIVNPVLTGKDVTDVNAAFVADPFMIHDKESYYMFFEVMNRTSGHGDIGYATSTDAKNWSYQKIVIDEEFHLSYPYVFKWDNNFYLIPESHHDLSVRLYKASSFPDTWVHAGTLLSGYHFVDPSIVRHNERWWLFVSNPDCDVLNLYYANDLNGPWNPHPMNPVVKFNKHAARPGGRILQYEDRLFRLAQDDAPTYGIQVFAFEIITLTETDYQEKQASRAPIVSKTGNSWNAAGMHHVDLHTMNDQWIGIVDGRRQ